MLLTKCSLHFENFEIVERLEKSSYAMTAPIRKRLLKQDYGSLG